MHPQKAPQSRSYFTWWGSFAENMGPEQVCEAFNKIDPNLQVEYTRYVNDDAGNTKLDMTLMSDDSIDVFLNMNDVLLMKRIENGYMYPLDELFEGAGFSLEDDYDENITQKEINGHYYSLPAKRITSTILYNQQMFDDARAAGLFLFVREGYRTAEDQQQIMDERITKYENQGYSKTEVTKLAEEYVAIPGTSEHQLGLSVDINADTTKCSSEKVYQWLDENAWKYGFIKRYPSDKTDITGISNEPWHYRYVGKDAAKTMKEENLCLEEYLEQYKK